MNNSGYRTSLATCALLACTAAFTAPPSGSAGANENSDALARHKSDVALCNSGQSNQDRATCRREAEAALMEARRGGLSNDAAAFERNRTDRCGTLPTDQRGACMARMQGQGTTSGSVAAGGLYRELVVRDDPADASQPAPVPTPR